MADIKLNTSNLLDAARKMDEAASRIDGAIGRLDNIMGNLNGIWNDQNSRKFLEKYEELKKDFPAFKEAAHNYSAFLNAVVETYRREFLEEVSENI